jgi:hypothetical protein
MLLKMLLLAQLFYLQQQKGMRFVAGQQQSNQGQAGRPPSDGSGINLVYSASTRLQQLH